MTRGEFRVGVAFNPSSNPTVDKVKRQAASLIDTIEAIAPAANEVADEVARLKALAQTDIESAAMWAVKAATKRAG